MIVITVDDSMLAKREKFVLNNSNIKFESGKIHGLVGRNKNGKKMLMKCICGLIYPTVEDINDSETDSDFPDSLGVAIETPDFIPAYSGYKNLKLMTGKKRVASPEQIKKAMEMVGLAPGLKLAVNRYSLGMRQRLTLAYAIMVNPDVYIAKEGTSDMSEYLRSLGESGKTILIASYSTKDISLLCDTVYEIEKGVVSKISGW
ncbi:MAG: ATP-binding cassette domain-containing protein [Ruminococcus sp.]|jgi:ABC-2 type transport system ATP-binding protein|nr:ATP-binding cassette domain-containing protein [Ruminococcus sp.]